jgi:hypothetical protein
VSLLVALLVVVGLVWWWVLREPARGATSGIDALAGQDTAQESEGAGAAEGNPAGEVADTVAEQAASAARADAATADSMQAANTRPLRLSHGRSELREGARLRVFADTSRGRWPPLDPASLPPAQPPVEDRTVRSGESALAYSAGRYLVVARSGNRLLWSVDTLGNPAFVHSGSGISLERIDDPETSRRIETLFHTEALLESSARRTSAFWLPLAAVVVGLMLGLLLRSLPLFQRSEPVCESVGNDAGRSRVSRLSFDEDYWTTFRHEVAAEVRNSHEALLAQLRSAGQAGNSHSPAGARPQGAASTHWRGAERYSGEHRAGTGAMYRDDEMRTLSPPPSRAQGGRVSGAAEQVAHAFQRWCRDRGNSARDTSGFAHALGSAVPGSRVEIVFGDRNLAAEVFYPSGGAHRPVDPLDYWLVSAGGDYLLLPRPSNAQRFVALAPAFTGAATPETLREITPARVRQEGSVWQLETPGHVE